jgi:hypothetical protein
MSIAFKILGGIVTIMATFAFSHSLLFNQDFRSFYWALVGQDILYAGVGAVATFAIVIGAGSLLWHKE